MAERSFPFSDTDVQEGEWRDMFRDVLSTGVFKDKLNELEAFGDASGMQVKVRTGRAWMEGHFYESDAEQILAIAAADATNPRIDRVVVRADFVANTITLAVLTGTAAVTPDPPALTQQEDGTFEISLAQVAVAAAASTIAAGDVTDERTYTPVAPAIANADGSFLVGAVKIDEVVLTGTASSIDFQNISADFDHLLLIVQARSNKAAADTDKMFLRFNSDATAVYDVSMVGAAGTAAFANALSDQNQIDAADIAAAALQADTASGFRAVIHNYRRTTWFKTAEMSASTRDGPLAEDLSSAFRWGYWKSTAAITEINLTCDGGSFVAGSVATLYGLR